MEFLFCCFTSCEMGGNALQLKARKRRKIVEDWREEVYDAYLKGHKKEWIRGIWCKCLGSYGPERNVDICCHTFKRRPVAMVRWFSQPHTAAGLQARSGRGLDFTRMGFCLAGVRKRESGSGVAVDLREFIYKGR